MADEQPSCLLGSARSRCCRPQLRSCCPQSPRSTTPSPDDQRCQPSLPTQAGHRCHQIDPDEARTCSQHPLPKDQPAPTSSPDRESEPTRRRSACLQAEGWPRLVDSSPHSSTGSAMTTHSAAHRLHTSSLLTQSQTTQSCRSSACSTLLRWRACDGSGFSSQPQSPCKTHSDSEDRQVTATLHRK